MYGVVLMMAMSGASEAPDCGLLHRLFCGCWHQSYYSCSGCSGCTGCHGYSCSGCSGCTGVPPTIYYSVPQQAPAATLPMPQTSAPATIQISVPVDAVLFFDGTRMNVAPGTRSFSTPALQPGKTYFYTVRAEVVRDGQLVATSQRVIVRSGQQAQLAIDLAPNGVLTSHQD